MRIRVWMFWLLPLLAHGAPAYAWGLATHVYFSQLLLWSIPLLDPRLRAAVRCFPRLVLAGACLPDLALVARHRGFRDSHAWTRAARLLKQAETPQARAIALGYASHLFVDIVAHNHFVPAHEQLWLRLPMLTHAVSEWAMDAHISRHLFARPHELLREEQVVLVEWVAGHFDCARKQALASLTSLARAAALLYGSGLHRGLSAGARLLDRRLAQRFDHYVTETARRLPEINRFVSGEVPNWPADVPCPERTRHLRELSFEALREPLPLPTSLYG